MICSRLLEFLKSQAWWYILAIQCWVSWMKQEDHEFENSLSYIERPHLRGQVRCKVNGKIKTDSVSNTAYLRSHLDSAGPGTSLAGIFWAGFIKYISG